MCTVSFIPAQQGVIITSNRDEKIHRPAALPPKEYLVNDTLLYYPKDTKAGGTWFIANDKGDAGILLNGAFKKHTPKALYNNSRGAVLPAIFSKAHPLQALRQYNFNETENCTLVLYINQCLYQFHWDGNHSTIHKLDASQPHIWSSVTLYCDEMIASRKEWFTNFLSLHPQPTQQQAVYFHTHTQKENKHFGLQMNRDNHMLTVSVTSVLINKTKASLLYTDCINQQQTHLDIALHQPAVTAFF